MSDIVDLMQATVKLEQSLGNGTTISGTGFVVAATAADGSPRLILVTANHVLERMARDKVRAGFRNWEPSHGWRYAPVEVRIRNAEGEPVWTKHPTQDIAALVLPKAIVSQALPIGELPGERALEKLAVQPGDEMMSLGFPRGIAANAAGFPILRSGKVASYPLSPADRYPTYLVDIDVFGGNSGGPVYLPVKSATGGRASEIVVTGVLTQQIKYKDLRLAIGNVTQADFISETVSLMDGVEPVDVAMTTSADAAKEGELGRVPAASPDPSSYDRLKEAWADLTEDLEVLLRRTWILVRDRILALLTPDAHRSGNAPQGNGGV